MPLLTDQTTMARQLRDADQPHVQAPRTPTPQLSVIMPAHNVGPWIRETLESLMAQTYQDFELIIVDDHSQDQTPQIVAEFAERHELIRVVRPEGRGGAHARNVGLLAARGAYLAFCDGDDIVPEGAYAALMAATGDSPDIVFGDFLKFSPEQTWRPSDRWNVFDERRDGLTLATEPGLLRHRACWNKVFRADFWHQHDIVFPEVPRSNDIVPMTYAYLKAQSISITPDFVYIYRERPGASSMSSRAGSSTSLISYLQQENLCSELLDAQPSDAVRHQHSFMLANSDGWTHVAGYLTKLAETGQDQTVTELIGAMVDRIDAAEMTEANLRRRLVLGLCQDGDLSTAALALELSDGDHETDIEWLRGWISILRTIRPESAFVEPDETARRFLPRGVFSILTGPGGTQAGEDLLALLQQLGPKFISTGAFASIDVRLNRCMTTLLEQGPAQFATRLAAVADVAPTLNAVQAAGRAPQLEGRVEPAAGLTLSTLALLHKDGALRPIGEVTTAPAGDCLTWSAKVKPADLPESGKLPVLLVGRTATGVDVVLSPRLAEGFDLAEPAEQDHFALSLGTGNNSVLRLKARPQPTGKLRRVLGSRLATLRR